VAVPLFILLGEILLRSGIAEAMYGAATHWLSWLPGGLMHSNVGSCAMFAAISGSSVATAATIGTVAIDQIEKRGYNERFFLGTIAAGGTIGILIPPSINMIVYGVLTDTSIVQLYLAGFTPGFLLAGLFMLTIVIGCVIRPALGGQRIETNWQNRIRCLPDLIPPIIIFVIIIGSIYAGWATPTESAALGVLAALGLVAWRRRLTWSMMRDAVEGTMRSTAMIMAILVAAKFLNFVIGAVGLTGQVNAMITGLGWTPMQTLIAVIAFYVVLGMFMETLVRSGVVRGDHHPVDRDRDDHPAGRHQPVRGAGRARPRAAARRDDRGGAVRRHADRDDRVDRAVPGDRAVAAQQRDGVSGRGVGQAGSANSRPQPATRCGSTPASRSDFQTTTETVS
jgi:tripartite ATP-independent transporter DctM subunit